MAINGSFTEAWRRTAGRLLLIFAGVALGGCSVAHMALPRDSQGELSELPVEGLFLLIVRNSFQFEPYHVTDVHQGWTKAKGWSIAGYSASKAKQKYGFSIDESGRAIRDVQCVSRADWQKMDLENFLGSGTSATFGYNRQLLCIMTKEGGGEPAKLVMAQSASELIMEGAMTDGDTRIDISVTYMLAQSPLKMGDPTGYLFHIGGRFVGAVEVINEGTVWIHNAVTPETRSALAAASAVLLMSKDIKEVVERN